MDFLNDLVANSKKMHNYFIGEIGEKQYDKSYLIQGDGIYLVFHPKCGDLFFKIDSTNISGLESKYKETFYPNVPKMPQRIFDELLALFQKAYEKWETEFYIRIYFDPENKEWIYYIPEQELSSVRAYFEDNTDEIIEMNEKYILVMEVHSHHTMRGSFSSIDDTDHQYPNCIHLVIGDIFEKTPTYQIRYANGDNKVNIKYEEVFEVPEKANINVDEVFPNWQDKFTEKKESYIQPKFGFPSIQSKKSSNIYGYRKNKWEEDEEEYPAYGSSVSEQEAYERETFNDSHDIDKGAMLLQGIEVKSEKDVFKDPDPYSQTSRFSCDRDYYDQYEDDYYFGENKMDQEYKFKGRLTIK